MHKTYFYSLFVFYLANMLWCTTHAMESDQVAPAFVVTDAQKLSDVYKHRTQSIYHNPTHVTWEFSNPILMQEALIGALKRHDLNYCLGLLAKGVPLTYMSLDTYDNVFDKAIDADYAPFCEFLLDESLYSLYNKDSNYRFPLERALYARSAQVADLFIKRGVLTSLKNAKPQNVLFWYPLSNLSLYHDVLPSDELSKIDRVFQVLIQHGENMNKIPSGSYWLDKIPSTPGHAWLQAMLPLLMKHGLKPELCDDRGNSLLYRKKEVYIANIFINNDESKKKYVKAFSELICMIALHHEYAREQERIYTLLAIYKLRKDSLIARLPKDVLHCVLIPRVRTFKMETLPLCVQNQCNYLRTLLLVKPQEQRVDGTLSFIKQQANTEMQALLYPEKVQQHYDQLLQLSTHLITQKQALQKQKTKVS